MGSAGAGTGGGVLHAGAKVPARSALRGRMGGWFEWHVSCGTTLEAVRTSARVSAGGAGLRAAVTDVIARGGRNNEACVAVFVSGVCRVRGEDLLVSSPG